MKNIKLIIGLLFIYSCAPVNTISTPSVSPSAKPSIAITPQVTNSASVSAIIPSQSASTDPNIIVNSPTPSPIPSPFKEISKIEVISDEGQRMVNSYTLDGKMSLNSDGKLSTYKNYDYNSLFKSQAKFITKITYRDGSTNDDGVIWSISNPNVATIDQTGLVTTKNKQGETTITAALKNDPSKTLSFSMHSLEALIKSYTYTNIVCKNDVRNEIPEIRTYTIPRYIDTSGGTVNDYSSLGSFNLLGLIPRSSASAFQEVTVKYNNEYIQT